MTDDGFAKAVEQQAAASAAMQNGDPGPMINCWADSDDITLFGARATFEKGYKAITDTMRWVAGRFAGADAVDMDHAVIASSGDLGLHRRLRAQPCQLRGRASARHGGPGHPYLPAH